MTAQPVDAATHVEHFSHYVGRLIHWGAAEWRHKFHGGPDPGPVPLPGDDNPTPAPGPNPPTTGVTVYWRVDSKAAHLVSDVELGRFIDASNADAATFRADWPHVEQLQHIAGNAPSGGIQASIMDKLPEAPDALAYHSVSSSGTPFIRVGAGVCAQYGVSWTSAGDHETKETAGDPPCTVEVTDPQTGWTWAFELCDQVESDSYQVDGVELSNYLLPAAFDRAVSGPVDKLGKDTLGPFTIDPGGYAIIDKHDGQGAQAVYGERFPEYRRRHVESLRRMGTPRRPAPTA